MSYSRRPTSPRMRSDTLLQFFPAADKLAVFRSANGSGLSSPTFMAASAQTPSPELWDPLVRRALSTDAGAHGRSLAVVLGSSLLISLFEKDRREHGKLMIKSLCLRFITLQ